MISRMLPIMLYRLDQQSLGMQCYMSYDTKRRCAHLQLWSCWVQVVNRHCCSSSSDEWQTVRWLEILAAYTEPMAATAFCDKFLLRHGFHCSCWSTNLYQMWRNKSQLRHAKFYKKPGYTFWHYGLNSSRELRCSRRLLNIMPSPLP